jgi:hypothetical protein
MANGQEKKKKKKGRKRHGARKESCLTSKRDQATESAGKGTGSDEEGYTLCDLVLFVPVRKVEGHGLTKHGLT